MKEKDINKMKLNGSRVCDCKKTKGKSLETSDQMWWIYLSQD